MKIIKESPYHKVWKAIDGDVFGFQGEHFKYLVVDLRHGGKTALRTNSLIAALGWEPSFTTLEIMERVLLEAIEECSHKNTDFNRSFNMDIQIRNWNSIANKAGFPEFVITESFSRRQALANKFAEIYESL